MESRCTSSEPQIRAHAPLRASRLPRCGVRERRDAAAPTLIEQIPISHREAFSAGEHADFEQVEATVPHGPDAFDMIAECARRVRGRLRQS